MLRVFLVLFLMSFSFYVGADKQLIKTNPKRLSQFNVKLKSYEFSLKNENFNKKVSQLPDLQGHSDLCNEETREDMDKKEFKEKRKKLFEDLKKFKQAYIKEMDAFSHHFLKNLNHFLKNLNQSLDLSSLGSDDLKKKAPELEKKIKELFKKDSYFSTSYNHLFDEYENYFKVLMTYLMKNLGFYYDDNDELLNSISKHYEFEKFFKSGVKAYCLNDAVFSFVDALHYKTDSSIASMDLHYESLYLDILGMERLTDHFLKQSLNCVSGSCIWTDSPQKPNSSDQINLSIQEGFFLRLAHNLKQLAMDLSKIPKKSNSINDDLQGNILNHIYNIKSSLNLNSLNFLENQFKITRLIFSKHMDDSFQEYCEYSFVLDGEKTGDVCQFH